MHRSIRLAGVVVALLVAGPLVAHAQRAPRCAAIALDSAGMMQDVYRLADDSMKGRRVGTPEGAKARDFIAARFDALGLDRIAPGRIHPFETASRAGTVRGFNVVGAIKGSTNPDEFIVVSAHFDHIGTTGPGTSCRATGADSICNGADDNASGTAGLLALARTFMHDRPRHTLIFVAFDAEESGDVGSHAWVATAPIPLDRVLVDVNMDMVGRNVKNQLYASGPGKYVQLRPLIDETIGCSAVTLTVGHDGTPGTDDWTNQSDQGAFNAQGIPFVYFGEEDHPDYHRATDHADRLMAGFYAASVRSVGDFIRRFDRHPVPRAAVAR